MGSRLPWREHGDHGIPCLLLILVLQVPAVGRVADELAADWRTAGDVRKHRAHARVDHGIPARCRDVVRPQGGVGHADGRHRHSRPGERGARFHGQLR